MTPRREAIGLPILFLSVLLAGSMRIGGTVMLLPPSPYELVLGLLLVRVAIQSGALAPDRLLASTRSTLANVNGGVLLATLWLAAAQTLAVLIPQSGVPRLAFSVFFLMLLLNTAAASPDRQKLLRSLAVTFGGAFLLKFVVLDALSAPGESAVRRALLAMVDGVTAGVLIQAPHHPVTPYVALAIVGLFLIGMLLLPYRQRDGRALADYRSPDERIRSSRES
jgi:hypothetical protein